MLRRLIYTGGQQQLDEQDGPGGGGGQETKIEDRGGKDQRTALSQEQQDEDEAAGLIDQGRLEAAIWRKRLAFNDHSIGNLALNWRRHHGYRPSSRAPLHHWPTSLLMDCREMPGNMHVFFLRRLFYLLLASQDGPGIATVLRLLNATQPARLELLTLEGNLWLLTENFLHHERQRQREGRENVQRSFAAISYPQARRIIMYLKTMMGARLMVPPSLPGERHDKSVGVPDPFRVVALSHLLAFLVKAGDISYAMELLQQDAFLWPFDTSPHIHLVRCLVTCLDVLVKASAGGGTEKIEELFINLVQDPLRCFQSIKQQRQQQQGQQEPEGRHRRSNTPTAAAFSLEAVKQDVKRAYEGLATAAEKGGLDKANVIAMHAASISLQWGSEEQKNNEEEQGGAGISRNGGLKTTFQLWKRHCQDHPKSIRVQMLAYQFYRAHLGRHHPRTITCLKAWLTLDATNDTALEDLVLAYRRQLLRTYRDVRAPILISRRCIVHALIGRLLALPPSSFSPADPRRLRYFRWLANYLGPLRHGDEEMDRHPLQSVDWTQRAVAQEALAGRFRAWSWCLRGQEDVTLDLFHPEEVRMWTNMCRPRQDAFKHKVKVLRRLRFEMPEDFQQAASHSSALNLPRCIPSTQWHEVKEGHWQWPVIGATSRRKAEKLWATVKHSAGHTLDFQEEDAEEKEHENENSGDEEMVRRAQDGEEEEDADDLLLQTCARGDDDAEGEEGGDSFSSSLYLLAYKSVAAVHMLGPRNLYTVGALRLLWDMTQERSRQERFFATNGASPPPVFGMLQVKFNLDVKATLVASDGYILASSQVQAADRLSPNPVTLGLVEAATKWPLPALDPPRLVPAALRQEGRTGREQDFEPHRLPSSPFDPETAATLEKALRHAIGQETKEQRERRIKEIEKKGGAEVAQAERERKKEEKKIKEDELKWKGREAKARRTELLRRGRCKGSLAGQKRKREKEGCSSSSASNSDEEENDDDDYDDDGDESNDTGSSQDSEDAEDND